MYYCSKLTLLCLPHSLTLRTPWLCSSFQHLLRPGTESQKELTKSTGSGDCTLGVQPWHLPHTSATGPYANPSPSLGLFPQQQQQQKGTGPFKKSSRIFEFPTPGISATRGWHQLLVTSQRPQETWTRTARTIEQGPMVWGQRGVGDATREARETHGERRSPRVRAKPWGRNPLSSPNLQTPPCWSPMSARARFCATAGPPRGLLGVVVYRRGPPLSLTDYFGDAQGLSLPSSPSKN